MCAECLYKLWPWNYSHIKEWRILVIVGISRSFQSQLILGCSIPTSFAGFPIVLAVVWGQKCVVTLLHLGLRTQGGTCSCMSWSVPMAKNVASSVLTVFNLCLFVLIMSGEDGVHADEAAQSKLKREVMYVFGRVRGNENCCSQTSLWCEWIVSSFII